MDDLDFIENHYNEVISSGTEVIPPLNKSQRSISIMTSKGIIQELTDKDTQVFTVPSIRKISMSVLVQEHYKDAKSSVVTGTKVTSVSSAQIQAASETSRISRGNTVNTGTEAMQSVTSEKSTSCALKTFADAGNSASDLVDRASYNNGSHHTLISFVTGIHPVCTSACMNTDLELNDKSTKTGLSFDKRFEKANKSTRDVYAQYSGPFNRSSNDTWDQSNSRCLANIGRSRLMAVRTLINSVTEMATQVEPVFHCAETNTTFKPKKSTSVLTSRYSIDRSNSTLQAHPLRSNSKVHPEGKGKTVLSLTTQTEPKVSPADSNTEPNAVISSKLNATKWMKGYIKESVKDVESIISISETMVAESLDRASLVIALSQDRKSISEMKKLSKVLINHQPAISCVTASGYNPSSSVSVTKLLPIKDKTITQEEQTHMNKQNETDVMIFNQMKSDENTTNDIKQHMSQLHPNLCDTVSNGTGYHATPSASINKVLPTKDKSIIEEQNLPIKTQNRNDLVMVNQMTSGTDCDVKTSKQQSASVLTSRHILASPPRCSNTRDDISGDITCKKPGSISNRSIGLATSFAHHLPCSRQKSYIGGDVLSPQVYKALYETTKLIAKNGSATTTPKISAVQATTKKTDNEDAIRDPRTQSNGVSPMPACLLSAPAHCCCARCLNAESMKNISIQAVADSFLDCPQCSAKIALLSNDSHHESTEKCMESYLVASCRYYSNLLTIKLGQVKENFIKHLALPIEDASHHATVTFPDNISHCTVSNNNIILTEACTMKPSGKQDENCEAKFLKQKFNQHSCILFPALSLTDVRGNDKNDLKNVYCILTAIEGRVRRLRNNLTY
ncbi:jg17323 [Pararge aegeria aegeria]|uniref:Jg17323 protein n=1 Tax=Pararge aegeria aegeria TaxID=348720 RepID=A0A8S4SPM1_9NEOP|nr:jg17323 [Pararge aegeria aegeria]